MKTLPRSAQQTVPSVPFFLGADSEDVYEPALERVQARVPALLAREERRFRKAIALLRSKGPHKLPAARVPRFVALRAYRELSWELRHENPAQMLELARLALQEAEHLDVEQELGWERSRTLAALTWAEVGNALRVNDRFEEAEQAFGMARHCLRMGQAGERVAARIHNLESSLLADRGLYARAIEALDLTIALYLRLRDHHLAGCAFVTKGGHLLKAGELEASLQVTREGLSHLDSKRDPATFYVGVHNVARGLLLTGRAAEARDLLRQNRGSEVGERRLFGLRHSWLEGEVAVALGKLAEADRKLALARTGLREAGRPYDAAIVAIELASLRLRQGRAEESRALCLQASEELLALDLESEARTAILMLIKAYEVGSATVQLVQGIGTYLRNSDLQLKATPASAPHP